MIPAKQNVILANDQVPLGTVSSFPSFCTRATYALHNNETCTSLCSHLPECKWPNWISNPHPGLIRPNGALHPWLGYIMCINYVLKLIWPNFWLVFLFCFYFLHRYYTFLISRERCSVFPIASQVRLWLTTVWSRFSLLLWWSTYYLFRWSRFIRLWKLALKANQVSPNISDYVAFGF